MRFEEYNISEAIKVNLEKAGFKRPTDIQFKAIPSILKKEDVLAVAQTGTGKTAAFAIPVIDIIDKSKSSKRSKGIFCLILVPTRELAAQIAEVFNLLAKHTKVKTFALYGGIEQDAQIKRLQNGIDILISTPGRMFDLISQGFIDLDSIRILILDEADRMLDLGFIDDIKAVKQRLKKRHQTLFFSATINDEIKKLAFSQVKSSAIRIQISPEDPISKNITHNLIHVKMEDKRFFLERIIKDNQDDKILVFVRTRVRAERVAKAMERVGIDALFIHGDKDQRERLESLKDFKSGLAKVLIATDVSARGIDIPDIQMVINYDLPDIMETYVHRIGRTGRGVRKGLAISFCSEEEVKMLKAIEKDLGKPIVELEVGKASYEETIRFSAEHSLESLIAENEAYEQKKRKRKRRKN